MTTDEKLDKLIVEVEELRAAFDEAREHIKTIKDTCEPAVKALQAHPMFKMFLGKVK